MDRCLAFLDSDVEAHEAFIQAMVEAKQARSNFRHTRVLLATICLDKYLEEKYFAPVTHIFDNITGTDITRSHRRRARRKERKSILPNYETKFLNFGYDVLRNRVSSLQKRALIGKWIFSESSKFDMKKWAKKVWEPLLGYSTNVSILMNAWFSIHFLHMDDADKILKIPQVRGRSFLQLHKWYIGFNPLLDTPKNDIIWVKLMGLPL